ncbi:YesN/AraC family two-component response regulator [Pedobacter cryoconitis]|uniref:AraC family transcriptional regulator n=1 Tax=Pedobacter cryoconitis TaxID=188932 RepID=UPI00161A3811|nr:AraC family transcriptional regulator [Pedobacter cryoconitis]MBB6270551.1 YesN/AraC family two-component response regulator [Pedobacter cryoconitis]
MKNKHLHKPLDIFVSDMEHWNERPLIYQFFEIVQIIDGEGTRIVNENKFPYSKGSIFLFTPLDCRGFESSTNTRYCAIRFSEVFLEQYKTEHEKDKVIQWLKQLEAVFTNYNRSGQSQVLIKEDRDCNMITALIENMVIEYDNKPSYFDENLQHLVILVLNIISRNVSPRQITSPAKMDEPLINKILVYLHQHINCPGNLRIKHLAEQFNLSANYIGEYFKNLTGDSLHCYLTQYKMNIVEQRLIYGKQSIGQIADELGFSDESHLSRQFKKHKGMTAAAFRRQFKY